MGKIRERVVGRWGDAPEAGEVGRDGGLAHLGGSVHGPPPRVELVEGRRGRGRHPDSQRDAAATGFFSAPPVPRTGTAPSKRSDGGKTNRLAPRDCFRAHMRFLLEQTLYSRDVVVGPDAYRCWFPHPQRESCWKQPNMQSMPHRWCRQTRCPCGWCILLTQNWSTHKR